MGVEHVNTSVLLGNKHAIVPRAITVKDVRGNMWTQAAEALESVTSSRCVSWAWLTIPAFKLQAHEQLQPLTMFYLLQCCITAHEKILNTYSGQMQFDYELQD